GFPCGRVWEISFFQDGSDNPAPPNPCPHPRQFKIFGGGEGAVPAGTIGECHGGDPDLECRNLWRWELSQDKITLFVNGKQLMEHTALPGVKALPEEFVNSPVYVYFSSWLYSTGPNRAVRYH